MKAKEREVSADKIFVFGDFNTTPNFASYELMKELGFKSAYATIHGEEPEWTFGGNPLEAPFKDLDPAMCLDYIFFKGDGVEITSAELTADKCVPGDTSLYASDHRAIVCDFKFWLTKPKYKRNKN